MKTVQHDIIENPEVEELDLNKAFEDIMRLYSKFGTVKYELMFAITIDEKRGYRFKVSGEKVRKV